MSIFRYSATIPKWRHRIILSIQWEHTMNIDLIFQGHLNLLYISNLSWFFVNLQLTRLYFRAYLKRGNFHGTIIISPYNDGNWSSVKTTEFRMSISHSHQIWICQAFVIWMKKVNYSVRIDPEENDLMKRESFKG
jgi:hypothetical protein